MKTAKSNDNGKQRPDVCVKSLDVEYTGTTESLTVGLLIMIHKQ